MPAILYNLTTTPVIFDSQHLNVSVQPLRCSDPLPATIPDAFFLVPACMADGAHARSDIVWTASIPHCGDCAPGPSERGWLAKLRHRRAPDPVLHTIEHYTSEDGRQGVGMEFFRQRYLQ